MNTPELTLGQALAVLEAESHAVFSETWPQFLPSGHDFLITLRTRLQALRLTEQGEKMFALIPSQCCETEKAHLADNIDLFLTCFLLKPQAGDGGEDCQRLFKHLNDCFPCFDEFSLVMRDYFHMMQKLGEAPQMNVTN